MNTVLNNALPVNSRSGLTSTPSLCISSRKYVMPLCLAALESVRASRAPHWENCAAVVQIFCPVIRHPPSTLVALVVRLARSDPAPGSENSWHQINSPRNVGGRKRCF